MASVQNFALLGVLGEIGLLGAIDEIVGLGGPGWVTGVACMVVVVAALQIGRSRTGGAPLGPADRVTLGRASLVCAVAGLTADAVAAPAAVHTPPGIALVALSVVALLLDGVDGRVARRTGTCSPLGAKFDGEVDAFLMLVLSVRVTPLAGAWVLAIGGWRYVFAVAGWFAAWVPASLPFRYWRKVVAATQGIVLTLAAAQLVPRPVTAVALVGALAMLSESFGRDVVWLCRRPRLHADVADVEALDVAARDVVALDVAVLGPDLRSDSHPDPTVAAA